MQSVGAIYTGNNRCTFTVWAPLKEKMMLHITAPQQQEVEMCKGKSGYFSVTLNDIIPGTKYFYAPDGGKDFPDPVSFYQPDGVHGPSAVIDQHSYHWNDDLWRCPSFDDFIIYELHIGTFTEQGTFEAAISRLDDLVDAGINAIEIMPVGQFPGNRNWGYDGVYPWAVQNSYGGPDGLKKLVDACHARGIAVILDVVYNHLGPEGNYLSEFAPYFNDKYHTPWGKAINFDGAWSDGVRSYFYNNALFWLNTFHIDGLRLDAIHEMYDFGAKHFWVQLHEKIKNNERKSGRRFYIIAESDLNDPKVVKDPEAGGYGFDAQWLDDFHHALYTLLYQPGRKRYEDFGMIEQLAKAYTDGFVHSGDYVKFRKKRYGASSVGIRGDKFIVFTQNHDQVGNRVDGRRLSGDIDHAMLKIGAAAMLLSPYVPMLYMGEEYGEDTPFCYFTSHSDEDLVKAVREGRKQEFARFRWTIESPDPQSQETFDNSRLHWEKRKEGTYKELLEWYKVLINLRKTCQALSSYSKNDVRVYILNRHACVLHRRSDDGQCHLLALFNFSEETAAYILPAHVKEWKLVLDSATHILPGQSDSRSDVDEHIPAEQQVNLPSKSVMVFVGEGPDPAFK